MGGGYCEYKHCLVYDGPAYEESKLTSREALTLLKHSGAWMLRNTYGWDCKEETNFWEVICDKPTTMEDLSSNTRHKVRRALCACDFRKVSATTLVEHNGYEVYSRAFERYKNVVSVEQKESWEQSRITTGRNNNKEFWGAFLKENGQLVAYAENTISGKGVSYNTLKAIPEMMQKHYVFYGLLFAMNAHYLAERGFAYVTDGFRSITEHSNIQPFLIQKFRFRKAYCRLSLYYQPWLKFAIAILYPVRKIIPSLKVKYILKFEEIRRNKC